MEKTNVCYPIITDQDALNSFIEYLPDLNSGEGFLLVLMARAKYSPDKKGLDAVFCRKVAYSKSALMTTLKHMEVPINTYVHPAGTKGVVIPYGTYGVYMCINPIHEKVAERTLKLRLVDKLFPDKVFKIIVQAENEWQLAAKSAKTQLVDLDIDCKELDFNKVLSYINPEAVMCIKTRNGYRLLVHPKKVSTEYQTTWYCNLTSLPGYDKNDHLFTPIPGCVQGDSQTTIVSLTN